MIMATKKYDMVVKTGEYQSGGSTKSRWLTVGSVMDDGKGGMYAYIDRTFNPAGINAKEGSSSIIISFFEPKTNNQQSAPVQQSTPVEDIPF